MQPEVCINFRYSNFFLSEQNVLDNGQNAKLKYRISANSFRGNYSFLNLTLFTVTFGDST